MITGRQIKAARALLGWDAADLAKRAKLSRETVSNIENDLVQARENTLADIVRVFVDNRLEFLDGQGVRFRPEDVEVLNGPEGMERFWNLVYAFIQTSSNVIIRQNGIPEGPLDACAPKAAAAHRERMKPLVATRKDIKARAIIDEGDMNFLCSDYFQYRWHPKTAPPPVPYYIFGDTVGIFAFDADPAPKVVLITSPTIARAHHTQFDKAWELALTPPQPPPQQTE